MILTNLVLSAFLYFNYVAIAIPPTDPTHIYLIDTSTNLPVFDNTDSVIFFGAPFSQTALAGPNLRCEEFFRVEDLGQFYFAYPF